MTGRPGYRAEGTSTGRRDGRHLNCALNVSLPGLGGALTRQIVENAHKRCPFSNATRGNVDIALNLV